MKRVPRQSRLRKFPASTFNLLVDFMQSAPQRLGPAPGPEHRSTVIERPHLAVPCTNVSGTDLVERSVVRIVRSGLTPPTITPPDEDEADEVILAPPAVEIDLPTATMRDWGVTLGPIEDEGTGWLAIGGLVWVRIDVVSEQDQFARPVDGEPNHLSSAQGGVPIYYRALAEETPPTTGMQWGLVMLPSWRIGSLRGARVTTAITPASDNLQTHWGSGEARLLDDATGAEASSATAVVNPLQIAFDVDYWVQLDTSHDPPRVVSGSCGAWTWAE